MRSCITYVRFVTECAFSVELGSAAYSDLLKESGLLSPNGVSGPSAHVAGRRLGPLLESPMTRITPAV
jgi:hypothetical protein